MKKKTEPANTVPPSNLTAPGFTWTEKGYVTNDKPDTVFARLTYYPRGKAQIINNSAREVTFIGENGGQLSLIEGNYDSSNHCDIDGTKKIPPSLEVLSVNGGPLNIVIPFSLTIDSMSADANALISVILSVDKGTEQDIVKKLCALVSNYGTEKKKLFSKIKTYELTIGAFKEVWLNDTLRIGAIHQTNAFLKSKVEIDTGTATVIKEGEVTELGEKMKTILENDGALKEYSFKVDAIKVIFDKTNAEKIKEYLAERNAELYSEKVRQEAEIKKEKQEKDLQKERERLDKKDDEEDE